jgi:hypothetical protein
MPAVKRDPSYPDRQRIDSDVRAFMRPVSSPWIVFDRDSRVDDFAKAALRSGAVFISSPEMPPQASAAPAPVVVPVVPTPTAASRLADINSMFPASVPNQRVAPTDEPSSLIVAADVVPDAPMASTPRKRPIALALGAMAFAGMAAFAITSFSHSTPAPAPVVAATKAPEPPPIVELPVAVEAPAPVEPAATTPPPAADVVGENSTDPKKRFGKLVIKGDATKTFVWFDGKRMLGKGDRDFLVFCGMHTVAVKEKTETKDMEVPCNGELVIGK